MNVQEKNLVICAEVKGALFCYYKKSSILTLIVDDFEIYSDIGRFESWPEALEAIKIFCAEYKNRKLSTVCDSLITLQVGQWTLDFGFYTEEGLKSLEKVLGSILQED